MPLCFDVEKLVILTEKKKTMRHNIRGELHFSEPRLNKTNKNFFRRTKLLYNYTIRLNKGFGTIPKATIQLI